MSIIYTVVGLAILFIVNPGKFFGDRVKRKPVKMGKYEALEYVKRSIEGMTSLKHLKACRKLVHSHYTLFKDINIFNLLSDQLDEKRFSLAQAKILKK